MLESAAKGGRRLRYRLHCIIDTAGKSLHGWFDAPRDKRIEARLKARNAIPDVPAFLNSPMAIDMTDLYLRLRYGDAADPALSQEFARSVRRFRAGAAVRLHRADVPPVRAPCRLERRNRPN